MNQLSQSSVQTIIDDVFSPLTSPIDASAPGTAAGIIVGVTCFTNGEWQRYYFSYGSVPLLSGASNEAQWGQTLRRRNGVKH